MRTAPANIEAEQALLGAIFVNNSAFDMVAHFLSPDHFYEPIHKKIYSVIGDMIRKDRTANPVTIKSFLPENEKIGDMTVMQYLARLMSEAMGVINAKEYGLAIHEMWIRRQAISVCDEIANMAYDTPPDKDILAALGPLEDRIAGLRADQVRGDSRIGIGKGYLNSLNEAFQRGNVRGVPICLDEISEVISEPCLEAGNLYGLLSSSGEGKTSLTIQMIVHALKENHPVLFLSYDQSPEQCIRQMVAQEYEIEARRQRDAKLLSEKEFEWCVQFGTWIDKMPFDVRKCTDQTAPQLVSLARSFVKRFSNGKVPLIVVDHIGSVEHESQYRLSDEGTKAKGINKVFKAGAEMTDSAWLVLNQRNSRGLSRDNPRPISADLFGGDPAKQAYDAVFYVYRFKKFLEDRKAIASSDSDWKKIEKVFPSAVRDNDCDIAEIGAIKVRFGNPHIKNRLTFEARLTRYKSERQHEQDQAELLKGI